MKKNKHQLVQDDSLELAKAMKLRQKASLLYGDGMWRTNALPKYEIKSVSMSDGPLGLRTVKDGETIPATCFPSPALMACCWDKERMFEVGEAMGKAAIHNNIDLLLAPGINIKRNPLCGRNFEYYSEDPVLSGTLASGYVNGIQSTGVGATLKHFAVNNQESKRFIYSAECDMRAINEIYLKGFKIAIKDSNPWAVMCSYNKIRGIYASDSDWLLKDVLRKKWGYEGVVMSDWGATNHPSLSHQHGLDLEMPCFDKDRYKNIVRSVKKRKVNRDEITASASRMIALSKKAGHFKEFQEKFSFKEQHDVAIDAALDSIVLAKNEAKTLPIKSLKDVAIIGALAKEMMIQGHGSSKVNTKYNVPFYDYLVDECGFKPSQYAQGYSLEKDFDEDKFQQLLLEAVDLASSKKKVIFFVGLPANVESEGYDREDMNLPEVQERLFHEISLVNQNIILVVNSGAPVELPFINDCKSVLLTYLPGEGGGEALAKIIMGKANPSGKLAETWPLHYFDVPNQAFYPGESTYSYYKESIYVGYRYYVSSGTSVMFPFGHGLSYSQFKYTDLKLSQDTIDSKSKTTVSVTVENTSKLAGKEVVELYIGAPLNAKEFRAKRELKDYQKISLEPGEKKTVSFEVPFDYFKYYNITAERFDVEDAEYFIEIGASCEDIRLSSPLKVVSGYFPKDRRYMLPTYYNLKNSIGFNVLDSEFEYLLDRTPAMRKRGSKRLFTFNSTVRAISKTWIGRVMLKKYRELYVSFRSPEEIEREMEALMDTPLRMLCNGGFREKQIAAIVNCANHKYISALCVLIFGSNR